MSVAVASSRPWPPEGHFHTDAHPNNFKSALKKNSAPTSRQEKLESKTEIQKNKLAFVLGVLHFWVCAYWLGSYPSSFYKLYSLEAFVLFPLRWSSFKKKKMHYYMFDFCYLANAMLLIFLWVCPTSAFLFKVLFAYNSGPLAWAIVLFKNSLVYHDLSQVTSLFIHWSPMLVSWTLRWYPDIRSHTHIDDTWFEAGPVHLLLWPMVPYIIWSVLYYLKLFVISPKKIRDRGYQTLYTYMLEEADFGLLKKIVYRFSPGWRPLAYMGLHLILVFASLFSCLVWWNYYWAHSVWLMVATMSSAWHGAAHYFH